MGLVLMTDAKETINGIANLMTTFSERITELEKENKELEHMNEWLDEQNDKMNDQLNRLLEAQAIDKPFLKIVDDYFIKYGDEEILFNLHKPSDIRSLIYNINRVNGYSELECEYNIENSEVSDDV